MVSDCVSLPHYIIPLSQDRNLSLTGLERRTETGELSLHCNLSLNDKDSQVKVVDIPSLSQQTLSLVYS